jgi:hypothetical protein
MTSREPEKALVATTAGAELDVRTFDAALLQGIGLIGLPTDQILVEVRHRESVIAQLPSVIEAVPPELRATSVYLSKFIAAVAAGLFDAALNYLWDETVQNVRTRASDYDLNYFFDQAAQPGSDLRTKLHSVEDLRLIDDQKLLIAANRIGLVSDVGLQQLDLVRYMRNFASAAHPNQVELRAQQLLGYLDACISEVINLKPSASVIEVKRLLVSIKGAPISSDNIPATAMAFDDLVQDQADNLAMGLFGIYTRPGAQTFVLENIRALLPHLWPNVSEETRLQFGIKTKRFAANQEADETQLAREYLETVEGLKYLPESMRVPVIDAALEAVLAAHGSWSNFAAEGPPVRELQRLVGDPPNVPKSMQEKYATTLVYVFMTNGSGVSWSAEPVYRELISRFTTREASFALNAITNSTIANRLYQRLSRQKFHEMLDLIDSKIVSGARRDLFLALKGTPVDDLAKAPSNRKIERLLVEAKRVKSTTRL